MFIFVFWWEIGVFQTVPSFHEFFISFFPSCCYFFFFFSWLIVFSTSVVMCLGMDFFFFRLFLFFSSSCLGCKWTHLPVHFSCHSTGCWLSRHVDGRLLAPPRAINQKRANLKLKDNSFLNGTLCRDSLVASGLWANARLCLGLLCVPCWWHNFKKNTLWVNKDTIN